MPLDNTSSDPVIDVTNPTPLPPGTPAPGQGVVGNGGDPDTLPASAFAGSDPEVLPKEAFKDSTPEVQPKVGLDGAIAGLQYRDKVAAAAKKYGLPDDVVPVLMAQGGVESGWNPKATSKAGAQGLFQLMPGTAKELGVTDPYDPDQNIDGGVKYASQLYNKFHGSIPMMVRAYNAGPNNPSNWNNPETNAYAGKVLPAAGPEAQEEDAALLRALGRPADQKWGFGQEATQAASLGLAKPVQAALESLTNGTPYHMERDLEDAYQPEWKANNFGAGIGADVLGSLVPGVGEAKLAMAGGRAMASAVPALAAPLSVALGLGQKGSMGTGILANLIRSVPAGAAQGAASSQVDTGTSPLEQTLVGGVLGPLGHLLAQPIEYGAKAAVSGLSRLGYGTEDWIKQGQQRIGALLGGAPPPIDSEIPGVNRTLPEGLLGATQGGVPQVTKLYAQLSKKAPEMAAPVEQANDLARLQHFHGALAGSPDELAALRKEIEDAGGGGRVFTKTMKDMPVDEEGPNGELPLNVLLKQRRTDVVDKELDAYQKVLRRVNKALYRQKAGQAEPVVPEDLEGVDFSGFGPATGHFNEKELEEELNAAMEKGPPKQFKQTAEELFGIRKMLQEMLNDKDQVPGRTTKAFLTNMKENIDSRLEINPQYKAWLEELNGKYKRADEMELLQTKGPQEFNSKNMVPQLARLSQMIKNAPNVVGVTSKKALPKSVSVDTAGEIDKLLQDALISRQAGAAHGGSMAGEEGGEAPIGLLHWGMGTGGSALGGALGGPVGGTLGWMGGMAAHVLARRQAAQNLSNYERGTLMALLYPKQYPPIMPKPNKLMGGVVGSGLGASTGNALLNFGAASGK